MFPIYVNALPQCLRKCELTFFADNTAVYTSAKDAATLEAELNADVRRIMTF